MPWNDNLVVGSPAYSIAASIQPHIRVLAGPGTGKSFAMKRRVARILEVERVNPAAVLAVTFTRVAAEDLHRELVSLGVPGAAQLSGRTLHSLAMTILMRQQVLAVLGRVPRPLNEFELEPLLADLGNIHGNKHERRRLIRAYGAAWARLQTQQPGYARTPVEQAFVDKLVEWLVLHEAMLIDEIIPHLFQYLQAGPGAPEHRLIRGWDVRRSVLVAIIVTLRCCPEGSVMRNGVTIRATGHRGLTGRSRLRGMAERGNSSKNVAAASVSSVRPWQMSSTTKCPRIGASISSR